MGSRAKDSDETEPHSTAHPGQQTTKGHVDKTSSSWEWQYQTPELIKLGLQCCNSTCRWRIENGETERRFAAGLILLPMAPRQCPSTPRQASAFACDWGGVILVAIKLVDFDSLHPVSYLLFPLSVLSCLSTTTDIILFHFLFFAWTLRLRPSLPHATMWDGHQTTLLPRPFGQAKPAKRGQSISIALYFVSSSTSTSVAVALVCWPLVLSQQL